MADLSFRGLISLRVLNSCLFIQLFFRFSYLCLHLPHSATVCMKMLRDIHKCCFCYWVILLRLGARKLWLVSDFYSTRGLPVKICS
jgi:hypothetical protein